MSEEIQIPETVWVVTGEAVESSVEGAKDSRDDTGEVFGRAAEIEEIKEHRRVAVPVQAIQQNMSQFLSLMGNIFLQAENQAAKTQQTSEGQPKPGLQLDQIEMSIEVNGKGEVSLWGIGGGEVGGKGAIKLTFKRKGS